MSLLESEAGTSQYGPDGSRVPPATPRPPRVPIRRDGSSWALQAALDRRGLGPVAGVDEAGRGACAGPLVVAACVLRPGDGGRFADLNDSKLLTAAARDRMFDQVVARALSYSVVVIDVTEVDADGVHAANIAGMRRAIARLDAHPGYILTDGFAIPGLTAPSIPVVKGDRAVACVSAASVLAKVTRDRIMADLHHDHPQYGFDVHKGYITGDHSRALAEHGPCVAHRWSFANIVATAAPRGLRAPRPVLRSVAALRVGPGSPGEVEVVVGHNGVSDDSRGVTAAERLGGTRTR